MQSQVVVQTIKKVARMASEDLHTITTRLVQSSHHNFKARKVQALIFVLNEQNWLHLVIALALLA
jgi:hypothetical protein